MYTGAKDATINWGFPGVGEIPLAADMDQDGITDIGLWVPGHSGTVSQDAAETFFLISHDFDPVTGQPAHTGLTDPTAAFNLLNHAFTPTPLGHDMYSNFLDEFATPIVGNFDPPLAPTSAAAAADTTAPTSSVNALAATQTSASFTVSWSGSDNSGGSGIASYDVYVSDNGGNFTRWQNHTANTAATFNGVNGHTYSFMSVATDNGGNVQATPTAAQATTKVQVQTSVATTTTLTATSTSITAGQSVTFTARVTGGTPTGSVTFKDGATTLTTVTLVSGAATYTNSSFAAGTHNITATYNPVAPNLGSVSATLVETVTTAIVVVDHDNANRHQRLDYRRPKRHLHRQGYRLRHAHRLGYLQRRRNHFDHHHVGERRRHLHQFQFRRRHAQHHCHVQSSCSKSGKRFSDARRNGHHCVGSAAAF